jgi:hypothetical protein
MHPPLVAEPVMLTEQPVSLPSFTEKDLRRQIDRSVSRALVDREFAQLLLNDPAVVLEDHGCPPQQYRSLRGICATDLVDFARQAQQLFWIADPTFPTVPQEELPLAAAR